MNATVTPICAFDIRSGVPSPIAGDWPEPEAAEGYRWLHFDLGEPNLEAWAHAHLPATAARALVQKETRPRCERLDEGLILNLRGVNLNPDSSPEDMVSLRLWVTERGIVSARRRRVFAVDAMRQAAEEGRAPASVGAFLAELTHGLAKRIEAVSLELEDQTDELEEKVLDGEEIGSGEIGRIRQAAIKMRRYLNPQREALEALAQYEGPELDETARELMRETGNRTRRALEELDTTRDRLAALHEDVLAEQTLALGRNSYLLSVVAAIFLPLGFLTGLFGVNVAGMPGAEWPFAFWGLTLGSVAVGVALYLVFKLGRWL
jgi:zinc transporter